MTRKWREAAAAEVERAALDKVLILMRAAPPARFVHSDGRTTHTPPVEVVALIGRAMADAAAIRAGAVDPNPGGTP